MFYAFSYVNHLCLRYQLVTLVVEKRLVVCNMRNFSKPLYRNPIGVNLVGYWRNCASAAGPSFLHGITGADAKFFYY